MLKLQSRLALCSVNVQKTNVSNEPLDWTIYIFYPLFYLNLARVLSNKFTQTLREVCGERE